MESMADFSVDLVFADPPFNLNKMYPSKMDDMIPEEKYIRWCEEWVTQCCRILKHGGSIFIWNLPRWNTQISRVLEQYVEFRNWISVEMTYSLPIKGRLYPSHYSLLYYVKGEKPNTFNPDRLPMKICRACFQEQKDYGGYKNKMNPLGINLSDVWTDISPVRHSKYKTRDSNELPLRLMDRIIRMSTKEGDIVFDPFGGSGTTFIVAELLNRRWIGTELGTLLDIKNRFNSIEAEKAYLDQIRSTTNVLFSASVKAERRKRHLWIPEDFQK